MSNILAWLLAILPGLGLLISSYFVYQIFFINSTNKIPNWVNSLSAICFLGFIVLLVIIINQAIQKEIFSIVTGVGTLILCSGIIVIIASMILIIGFPIVMYVSDIITTALQVILKYLNFSAMSISNISLTLFYSTMALAGALPAALSTIIVVKWVKGLFNIEELILATVLSSLILSILVLFIAAERLQGLAALVSFTTLVEIIIAALLAMIVVTVAKTTGEITVVFLMAFAVLVPLNWLIIIVTVGSAGQVIEGAKTLVVISLAGVPAILGGACIGWKIIH